MRFTEMAQAAGITAAMVAMAGCGTTATSSPSPSPGRTGSATSSSPAIEATSPAPTGSPSASATATGKFRQAYVNAFQDFWVAYARADEDGAPTSSLLSDRATGSALEWARKQISDHVKLGVAHRGVAHFREVGAEHVTARSALVGECQDWSGWPVVNRKTGAPFQQFDSYSQLVSGQMVLADGQWKLSTVRVQDARC